MGLVTDAEIATKIESPLNLFQRLKSTTSKRENLIVSIPPKAEDLIPDFDSKVCDPRAKALSIMTKALNRLETDVSLIDAKKLPSLIKDMGITVKNLEPDKEVNNNVQFIVYTPQLLSEEDFGKPISVEDK